MLKTKVKASSITNLTDARYFAAWGVEWLGFDFSSGSETNIPIQNMQAIKGWIDGVSIVGEFELHSPEEIATATELLGLDVIQVGMLTPIDHLIELSPTVPVIKEIVIARNDTTKDVLDQLDQFAPYCQFFLLNFEKNGISWSQLQSGQPFSEGFLSKICQQYSILLSIDLAQNTVSELLDAIPLAGLCLQGGQEEKIGLKSFDELDEILEALEVLE